MKGVILAAGLGTRLKPLTLATSKMLIPVYDKPIILHALNTLVSSGIKDILVVIGRDNCEGIVRLIGDGSDWGAKVSYAVQNERKGTANAVLQAESFVGKDKFAVIAGDNVFQESFAKELKFFMNSSLSGFVFIKEVSDPRRYGVVQVSGDLVVEVIEKPKEPKGNLALTFLWLFDPSVFDFIKNIKPSERGEHELPDLLSHLAHTRKLGYHVVKNYWSDVGTIENLADASHFFSQLKK